MKTTHLITTGLALVLAMALPMTSYGQSNDLKSTTVNKGVEAYQKGDYKRAYDIWSYHAKNYIYNGSESEQQQTSQAQTNLGVLYYFGKGTYQSNFMAAYWNNESATHGNHAGQNNMGEMHEKGLGVFKDPYKALELYGKSAAQGNPDGIKNLKRLEVELKGVARRKSKFSWESNTATEAENVSRAYSRQTEQPLVVYQHNNTNFQDSIAETYVSFLDVSSIKDVKIGGKMYKKAIFRNQYFRNQKFGNFHYPRGETYRSEHHIKIINCAAKSSATWTYQLFENDEQTGRMDNYSNMEPGNLNMYTPKLGTVGHSIVQAVCAGEYIYTPR